MASSRLAPTDDTYASPPQLDMEILFYNDKWTKLDADIGMVGAGGTKFHRLNHQITELEVTKEAPSNALRGSVKQHLLSICSFPFGSREQGLLEFWQQIRLILTPQMRSDATVENGNETLGAAPSSSAEELLSFVEESNSCTDEDLYCHIDAAGEDGIAQSKIQVRKPSRQQQLMQRIGPISNSATRVA